MLAGEISSDVQVYISFLSTHGLDIAGPKKNSGQGKVVSLATDYSTRSTARVSRWINFGMWRHPAIAYSLSALFGVRSTISSIECGSFSLCKINAYECPLRFRVQS